MKQILSLNHIVTFRPEYSFSQREHLINEESLKIQSTLRERGFFPLNVEVVNKNSSKATICVTYQA